jgi:hypothetical protein
MADPDRAEIPGTSAEAGAEPFANIAMPRNHWSRPASPRAYYWYLTFADAPNCTLSPRTASRRSLAPTALSSCAPTGRDG